MSDALRAVVEGLAVAALCYFALLNGAYIVLEVVALRRLRLCAQLRNAEPGVATPTEFEPAVSVIVPAYNEEATIDVSVRSLLQLSYPDFEVIVVNDGSKDGTMDVLRREFELEPFPESRPAALPTKPVRGLYRSRIHPNLRVIDKENGLKADALNAGINVARQSLFLAIDGDSILQRESLLRLAQPFLEDPTTVACGGTVRVANGCSAAGGMLRRIALPTNPVALFQIVEYLRAFLFGRMGWSGSNALLIISGAFGLFRRDVVIEAGGFRHDTIGEDMELTVRLHRHMLASGRPYNIAFVPDPVCWTEVPDTLRVLSRQRSRWHRGLSETLWTHRALLFSRGSGAVGWLAYPFFVLFEWAGPVVEALGWLAAVGGFAAGIVDGPFFVLFLALAVGLGVLLSVSALLLEEFSYHVYPRGRDVLILFLAAIGENLGYRQLTVVWRLMGLWSWATGKTSQWGTMTRSGAFGRKT